ncbi:unnamed protein product, partial [Darwinula stevensoni]
VLGGGAEGGEDKWSDWSVWSPCSQSCGGGAMFQTRRCLLPNRQCLGNPLRYRICSMQACPVESDFRSQQCAAYNQIAYDGRFYKWLPRHDPERPCALVCESQVKGEPGTEDESPVIAVLTPTVQDGTRCRPGSLDMCVSGHCQTVGCDLQLGSKKKVDRCGVCGGDGGSCTGPRFTWRLSELTPCSRSCDGGMQVTRPLCEDVEVQAEVDPDYCDPVFRPEKKIYSCNPQPCPATWKSGGWSECSTSCGGGIKYRAVWCSRRVNGTETRVSETECRDLKPRIQDVCNNFTCPRWSTGDCAPRRAGKEWKAGWCCVEITGDFNPVPVMGVASRRRPENAILAFLARPPKDKRLTQPEREKENRVPSEPTFTTEEWGPCSVTCGEGVQKRIVKCKIFLEFSRTVAELPDKECPGPKPKEMQRCLLSPCSLSNRLEGWTEEKENKIPEHETLEYSWRSNGYRPCSASCLGGVQESIIECVRTSDERVMSPFLCPLSERPDSVTRTCNEHPCPPRWSVSTFSPCSKPCGGGVQTRTVECVHEVTRGVRNILTVDPSQCPQPPPPSKQSCNHVDCHPSWIPGEWSPCDAPCGGGKGQRTRDVVCIHTHALGHTTRVPEDKCPKKRPASISRCRNRRPCAPKVKEKITVKGNWDQDYVQTEPTKKVTVKIGGKASLLRGTTLKIRCPVRRFDRSELKWTKDDWPILENGRIRISKQGSLRIRRLRLQDSGIYTCIAGEASGNLVLTVRDRDADKDADKGKDKDRDKEKEKEEKSFENNLIDDSYEPKKESEKGAREDSSRGGPWVYTYKGDTLYADQQYNSQKDLYGTLQHGPAASYPSPSSSSFSSIFPTSNFSSPSSDVFGVVRHGHFPPPPAASGAARSRPDFFNVLSGLQVRARQCIVKEADGGVSRTVDNGLCMKAAGLVTPETVRSCGLGPCPTWDLGEWSPCEESKCFTWNTAMQRREVRCLLSNGTVLDPVFCQETSRPQNKRECYNDECKGTWRVGNWSECTASCGSEGIRTRILQCVWHETKKAAGSACRDLPRPPVMKLCKGKECRDRSRYCGLVARLKMCRMQHYKLQCCRSCSTGT